MMFVHVMESNGAFVKQMFVHVMESNGGFVKQMFVQQWNPMQLSLNRCVYM